ncbi:hypothetical protein [Nocardia asteroides]|uniref:hypothetical protein n=1 Tax=Nocardia asteroides TaxID=1824 RepID=UPI00342EB37C
MFTARSDGRDIRGWSATVDEMPTILGRLGIENDTADSSVSRAVLEESDELPQDCGLDLPLDEQVGRLRAAANRPERATL